MVLSVLVRNRTPSKVRVLFSTLGGGTESTLCTDKRLGPLVEMHGGGFAHNPNRWVELPAGGAVLLGKYVRRPVEPGPYDGHWLISIEYVVNTRVFQRTVDLKGKFESDPRKSNRPFALEVTNTEEDALGAVPVDLED